MAKTEITKQITATKEYLDSVGISLTDITNTIRLFLTSYIKIITNNRKTFQDKVFDWKVSQRETREVTGSVRSD